MKYVLREKDEVDAVQYSPKTPGQAYRILAWLADKSFVGDTNYYDPEYGHLRVGDTLMSEDDYVVITEKNELMLMGWAGFEERYEPKKGSA